METNWCFISARLVRSKNRITPPPEVRNIVEGSHILDDRCMWWYYDTDTGFAVVSNTRDEPFVDLGRSGLGSDNVVVIGAGVVDAAFESLTENDCIVFLGTEDSLSGENRHLFVLHEEQVYDLLDEPSAS